MNKLLILLSFVFLSGCSSVCHYEYPYDNTICRASALQYCGMTLYECDNGMVYECVINVKSKSICEGE